MDLSKIYEEIALRFNDADPDWLQRHESVEDLAEAIGDELVFAGLLEPGVRVPVPGPVLQALRDVRVRGVALTPMLVEHLVASSDIGLAMPAGAVAGSDPLEEEALAAFVRLIRKRVDEGMVLEQVVEDLTARALGLPRWTAIMRDSDAISKKRRG